MDMDQSSSPAQKWLNWVATLFDGGGNASALEPPRNYNGSAHHDDCNDDDDEDYDSNQELYPDVLSDEYRAELVDSLTRLVKTKHNHEPKSTLDLEVEMLSIQIQRRLRNGRIVLERNWWIPINHPLVSYMRIYSRTVEAGCWRAHQLLKSPYGGCFIFPDHVVVALLHDVVLMFADQGIELENFLPPLDYDDDDDDPYVVNNDREQERQQSKGEEEEDMVEIVIHDDNDGDEKKPPAAFVEAKPPMYNVMPVVPNGTLVPVPATRVVQEGDKKTD